MAPARDASGALAPDPSTFPSGMVALSTYLHERGLRFGVYSSAGFKTCQGLPASLGHESQDASTFAAWSVDFLKYDNCGVADGSKPEAREHAHNTCLSTLPDSLQHVRSAVQVRYPVMRDALNATGRPIFISICEWGVDEPASWAREVGNSWRTTIDIEDAWLSVLLNLELTAPLWRSAGPGGWNDPGAHCCCCDACLRSQLRLPSPPDMLEVGNGGLSLPEERAHFSLWAALKAPLILGCDLTMVSADALGVVSNAEVIAINQDALGAAARRVWSSAPSASAPGAFRHVPFAEVAGGQLWREEPLSLAGARALCALGGERCTAFTMRSPSPDPDVRVPVRLYTGGVPSPAGVNNSTAHTYFKRNVAPADWREVWAAPLADGARAVVLFNRDDAAAHNITARWLDVGLCERQAAIVRDLWRHERVAVETDAFTAEVPPHDVIMLRITPREPLLSCDGDNASPPTPARDVPAGVWGLAWQEVLRALAPRHDGR